MGIRFAFLRVSAIIWLLNYVSPSMGAAEMLYSSHFIIRYEGDAPEGVFYQLPEILEEAYEILSQELGSSLTNPVEVKVYRTTRSFTQSTGKPWWIAATHEGSRIEIQPIELLRKRGTLPSTLRHELTHIFVNKISQSRCPLWLNEALALHFSGEGLRLVRKYGGRVFKNPPTPEIIQETLENPKDPLSSEQAYWQAYGAFQCLLKRQEGLKRLLYELEELGRKSGTSVPEDPFWWGDLFMSCKE